METNEQINSNDIVPNRKRELEEKKLQLEILELERPWFQKPAFLIPIIGALSSILVLWVTGFFNTKIESLTIKREQLSFETSKLKDIKTELIQDSISLEKSKQSLQVDTTTLRNRLRNISIENDSIKKVLHKNRAEIEQVTQTNNNLNTEIINKKKELKTISDSLDIATRPNLQIALHKVFIYKNMDIGIYVSNNGTGTAYFKNVNFYYKGKSFIGTEGNNGHFFERVIEDGLGLYIGYMEWEGRHLSNIIDSAGSLAPGQTYSTLKVTSSQADDNYDKFLKAIIGLEIEIVYQSSKGKEFVCRKIFTDAD